MRLKTYLCPINKMGFRFQQFTVDDDQCAMKVGTDGVLLGAWASADGTEALDVGTGCGLIALMLAERNPRLHVRAIDIAPLAVRQAQANFARSPFAERLTTEVADFRQPHTRTYDLIVCNPPFFLGGKDMDAARRTARQSETLPLPTLIENAARCLRADGQLAVIIPHDQAATAVSHAAAHGLHLIRRTDVRTTPVKPPARTLLQFIRRPAAQAPPLTHDELTLRSYDGARTNDYTLLTNAFYL